VSTKTHLFTSINFDPNNVAKRCNASNIFGVAAGELEGFK